MAETNVANTTTIFGRTDIINVSTNWRTITVNPTGSQQAYKVNSLFVANKHSTNAVDVDIRIGRIVNGANTYFQLATTLTVPRDATLIAICRDNPMWLQEGDFIQIRAGADARADATCSYELITDTDVAPPALTVPSAPLNVVAEPGSNSVLVEWDAPQFLGGSDLLDYVVQVAYRQTTSNAWTAFTTVNKPESLVRSFLVTSLTNSWQYKFRVAAINVMGTGPWSDESNIAIPSQFNAPTNVNGSAFDSAIVLSWNNPTNTNGNPLTGFRIRWSVDDGQTWLPDRTGEEFSGTSNVRTIINLTNGVPYTFSVRGVTAAENGPWSVASPLIVPSAAAGPAPINAANWNSAASWGGASTGGNLTSVGTNGGTGAYGTYDMAGNIAEWLEARAWSINTEADAIIAGGAYNDNDDYYFSASNFVDWNQTLEVRQSRVDVGFRLVSFETNPISSFNNDFVAIGNAGNAGRNAWNGALSFRQHGAVAYEYSIQKYEVTNNEYALFLNSIAQTNDTFAVFNSAMQNDIRGGITRTGAGTAGDPYVYTVRTDMGNKPVNFVTWYSAVRFANWMHNGRPATDVQDDTTTEDGAYKIVGYNGSDPANDFADYAATPTNPFFYVRKANPKYALPTIDEWYKAAFYNPANSNYYEYPTRSNTAPADIAADAAGDGPY